MCYYGLVGVTSEAEELELAAEEEEEFLEATEEEQGIVGDSSALDEARALVLGDAETEDDLEESVPDQPQPAVITTEELVEKEVEVQMEEEEELEAAMEDAEESQQRVAAESIEEEEIAVIDPGVF